MVILQCRQQNRDMNDCVSQFTTAERWTTFRQEAIEEFLEKGKVTKRR